MTKLDEALGLFPSVIKCGENWSATCQAVLDEAKAELAALRLAAQADAPQSPQQPHDFFTNVDAWGAAEWFDRMARAIREQDAAVLAKDDMAFETYRNIAASSATRLVREYEPYVRAALADTRPNRQCK